MALSLLVIPGYQFGENERLTQTKLNQLGRPTIELQGAISSAAIGAGTITADKLSPTLITGLTPTTPESRDLVMIHHVADNALRSASIGQILELGAPALTTITDVNLSDFAWIIRTGTNKQATIADVLREAINGQTELPNLTDVDKATDTLLIYDNSAAPGTNKNRKVKVQTAVRAVTNTLISDATALSGAIDPAVDELLVNDGSSTAGDQQRKVKVSELVKQVGGIKAWAKINGTTGAVLAGVGITNPVAHPSTGHYTITLNPALANANYAILATGGRPTSGSSDTGFIAFIDTSIAMTTSSFGVRTKDGQNDENAPIICVMVIQ